MKNKVIHIFYTKQTAILDENIFQQFLLQLPPFLQKEIKAYKHRESAQASLFGKMLLLYGFKIMNTDYLLSNIQLGNKDRPFIDDNLDFNVSHSGEYIIIAITRNSKVGIDIEKHRNLNIGLFKKYFDDGEWNAIQTSQNKLKTFFDFWTIKESAIKCDGRGVEVLSKTQILKQKVNCDGVSFDYIQLYIEDGYSCAVCSTNNFIVKSTPVFLDDFLQL
ncbi:MAG: 4'-phosphopantetheinyl transferase superfamily protein [Chitinophagales bacterium]